MSNKLYWKIFIGFWATTIVMILGTFAVVHETNDHHEKQLATAKSSPSNAAKMLSYTVRHAINKNLEELVQGFEDTPEGAMQNLYIIGANNQDILNRPLPKGFASFVSGLSIEHPFDQMKIENRNVCGRYLILPDGNHLRFVAALSPEQTTIFWQLFFKNYWPVFLVAILISGSLCYLMAIYVTRPLQALKRATRRIADGDLSVRIKPEIQGRSADIADLGDDFDHMVERLQQSMDEQKRLIKDVSHELRSPLMRLQFALGLAQQRSNGSVDAELERIKNAADYLNNIISDILSLPISENESWTLNDTVDLKALLETLLDSYHTQAKSSGLTLNLNCLQEALAPTHGNTLVGVFENLITNALRYSHTNTSIDIEVKREANTFIVQVCDHGPGLDEKQLEAIFKPFYRTDEARDRSSGGYGLGLAIAQRTVALHGGKVVASNNPEGGLCVSVHLPCGALS